MTTAILLVVILIAGGPAILGYLLGHKNGYSKGVEDTCRMRSSGDEEFWRQWTAMNNMGQNNGGRDAR